VSLVLTVFALIAGKNPGFMEDCYIIMLKTSELGQNLIPTPTSRESYPSPPSNALKISWTNYKQVQRLQLKQSSTPALQTFLTLKTTSPTNLQRSWGSGSGTHSTL
jgi:hypothetical protein